MADLRTPWVEPAAIAGLQIATAGAAIKRAGRDDILVFALPECATCAGVFTQSAFAAPPVAMARRHLAAGAVRFLIINSGNANACTGERGWQDALACCAAVTEPSGLPATAALPFSTGVIGEFLPLERILPALAKLEFGPCEWSRAARAIMTTDTCPKGASRTVATAAGPITVSGVAKGAGMIRPDMATMLAFAATDAAVAAPLLDQLLRDAVAQSFNRITIDGDTSTNDACVLMATGGAGTPPIESATDPRYAALAEATTAVMRELAQAIVRDGEGATKFIEIAVEGGADSAECLQVAYTIAHSPLVKTALYASDANWGRLVMAIGRAGVAGLDSRQVSVFLDDVQVVAQGGRADTYTEAAGSEVVARSEFRVRVDLGRGSAAETIWTCDLSHDYVSINADYRS